MMATNETNRNDIAVNNSSDIFKWHDGRPGAIKFACQGLSRMCDFLPYEDVLNCRLVCKDWELFITQWYPRFTKATVTLDEEIWSYTPKDVKILTERQICWKNVHLKFFPFHHESKLFPYWETNGLFVRTLYLQTLGVNCLELVKFLDECPSVKEITFDDIGFCPKYTQDELQYDLRTENSNRKASVCSCVPKNSESCQKSMDSLSSISSITFTNQNIIPLCLIAYLNYRSMGKLQKFTYKDATCDAEDREKLEPCKTEVEKYLAALISKNKSSLKVLTVTNSIDMGHFLDIISDFQLQHCEEIHLDCIAKNASSNKTFGFKFLRQNYNAKILNLGFQNVDLIELTKILDTYGEAKKLEKLKISLNMGQISSLLRNLNHLKELDIQENSYATQPKKSDSRRVNPNYLMKLPASLLSLTLTHYLNDSMEWELHTMKNLRQLVIKSFDFNDDMFRKIVSLCEKLEVLHICSSKQLSDTAITGISAEGCRSLRNSMKDSLDVIDDSPDIAAQSLLNNLNNLKILSLAGCRRISNVSMKYGIKSEKLRVLNLSNCPQISDCGFKHVALNCPNLERLILFHSEISLNQTIDIVCTSKKLLKIHLTKTKKILNYINDVTYMRNNYELLSSINNMLTTQAPIGKETFDYTSPAYI